MATQTWNSEGYAKNARFVTDLGAPVLELLAPMPGEHILSSRPELFVRFLPDRVAVVVGAVGDQRVALVLQHDRSPQVLGDLVDDLLDVLEHGPTTVFDS